MALATRYPELVSNFTPQDLTSAWGQLIRELENRQSQPIAPTDIDGRVEVISSSQDMSLSYAGISANATDNPISVNLPDASLIPYKTFFIKKMDSSSNLVVLGTTNSQTIDNSVTLVLDTQYQSRIIKSDGQNWIIIGGIL